MLAVVPENMIQNFDKLTTHQISWRLQ